MTGERRSPAAWVGSLALHGGILAATLFTFSHRLEISDQSPPVISVDVVTIAQKTNIRATARKEPRIAPTPTPPAPMAAPTPPVPQPKAEPAPEIPKETKETVAEPVVKAPSPKPVPKLAPEKPSEEKNKSFDVDKVLALLNKVAPARAAAPNAPSAARTVRGVGAQNAMTADLADSLKSQIDRCWSPPVGAPHPVIVEFEVSLNPDGSVARSPQLIESSGDPYFRAAAEAARRAIYTCAPYHLPSDRYDEWRDTDLHFDPSEMMGDQ